MTNSTLFEKIGGKKAVQAAVDLFYSKIMADDRVSHFFSNTDMNKQRRKQILFLTYVFGGPNNYEGDNMRDAHHHLLKEGLNDFHFDAVCENLVDTLKELNIPEDLIENVKEIAGSTRNDVLNR